MTSATPKSRHGARAKRSSMRFASWLDRFLCRDHVNVDVAAIAHEPAQQIRLQKAEPRRAQRFPHYNLRNVVLSGDTQQRFSNIPARRRNHFCSELARQRKITSQSRLFLLRKQARCFDVGHDPGRLHRCCQPARVANQSLRVRTRADRDQQAIPTLPRPGDFFLRHDVAQIAIDMFGHQAQRHFAQRREIAFAEEIFRRPLRAVAEINLSFSQTRGAVAPGLDRQGRFRRQDREPNREPFH